MIPGVGLRDQRGRAPHGSKRKRPRFLRSEPDLSEHPPRLRELAHVPLDELTRGFSEARTS